MVSRNYDDNEYRRNPQFARNEPGDGGRGGDYAYPPRIYGRDFYAPQDRYPPRTDYGYRDSDHLSRGGSGDAFRGYEGQGNNGYGADGRAGQGYSEDGYAPGGWVGGGEAPQGQWGPYGRGSDDESRGQYRYGGGAQEVRERSRRFDPDYYQWRSEQLNALDADYQTWREERYKKFADEFSQWRSGRSRPGEESKGKGNEKENANKNK